MLIFFIVKFSKDAFFLFIFFDLLKDVRSLHVNIDRAWFFGYELHEHFMQLILKFGQYLQHSLFITILKITVLTRHLMGGGCPKVNISDLVYTYYR